jgi:hypothetical protein
METYLFKVMYQLFNIRTAKRLSTIERHIEDTTLSQLIKDSNSFMSRQLPGKCLAEIPPAVFTTQIALVG